MEDFPYLIPLIDLVKIEDKTKIFWVCSNYAEKFQKKSYKISANGKIYCAMYEQLTNSNRSKEHHCFGVNSDSFLKFRTINAETMAMELFINSDDVINDGVGFAIGLFAAKYQLEKIEFGTDLYYYKGLVGYFDKVEVTSFGKDNFFPAPQQVDLVVQYFLKNISIDGLTDFLDFHLIEYEGTTMNFINHCEKLTNDIWNIENAKDFKRKKCFDNWVIGKLIENDLVSIPKQEVDKVGFVLGLANGKLIILYNQLIENLFLKGAEIDFINAFSGKPITNKLEWIDKAKNHYVNIQTVFQLLYSCNIKLAENTIIENEVKVRLNSIFSNDWGNINSKYNDFDPLKTERHKLISSLIETLNLNQSY